MRWLTTRNPPKGTPICKPGATKDYVFVTPPAKLLLKGFYGFTSVDYEDLISSRLG